MTAPAQTDEWVVTEPGLIDGMPDTAYHGDPVPAGSLSSTFARLLTKHVPAKAIEQHLNRKPTRSMDLGKAAHLQALGVGPQLIVWQHDGRTRAGKAEREDAAALIDAELAVAVSEAQRDQIVAMATALRAHPEVQEILDASRPEVSAFWRAGPVWLRARFDLLGRLEAFDYKTTQDVTRRGFSIAMGRYGYHQQGDFYERGLRALGHPAAVSPLRFICQEVDPPYLVQIHEPDEEAREVARMLNDRAIGIYAACSEAGHWPGYAELSAEPTALPAFYFFDNNEVLPDNWRPSEQDMVVPS